MEPTKKDWKLYREKIAGWQEAYMEHLIQEYMDYLKEDIPVSTKFWELEKRIKRDKKKSGVQVEMSRSNMIWDIVGLIRDGAITVDDLAEFSDELVETVEYILNR